MQPIEIFRSGKHYADNGKAYSFSEADLKAAADAYDPSLHQAPLVIGHPAHDDPAYGWVSALTTDGASMVAAPDRVNPEFSELVEKGAYKNVSASFYAPNAKGNPVPGIHYLRHVGFLGAKPPAIKGLKAIQFAETDPEAEDDIITICFAEVSDFTLAWGLKSAARLFRRMRDKILAEEGVDAADAAMAEQEIRDIEDAASRAERAGEAKSETTSFSEHNEEPDMSTPDTSTDAQKKLDEEKAALAAERAKFDAERISFAEAQAERRREEDKRFLDGLADDGKIAPGVLPDLLSFMETLDGDEAINFGEAEEDKMSAHAFLKSLLAKSGQVINFSETSSDDGDPLDTKDANAIAEEARNFQESERAAGRNIDTVTAVARVMAKN